MSNTLTKFILTGLIASSLLLSPAAFAGHNNHHSNHNSHGKHYKKYKRHHNSHHHVKHHYKRRHNNTGEIIGGIIGGVVIGGLIHNATRHHNSHNTTRYTNPTYYGNGYNSTIYQPPIAVNKTIIVNNTPTQTYRVLNGSDCYLVNYNNNGNEVLTQVPSVNCGF
jgi:hypothetical protein